MLPILTLLCGKLRATTVLSFICLTTLPAGNAFGALCRPWRPLMQKMCHFMAGLALAAGAAFPSSTAQAQTFQSVPLDGGGHLSGFAQADNGRIYTYGDVFGAWRTDNEGVNWTYLNWGIPDGEIVGYGMAVQKDNADVVYYSTNNSLFKSTDGGTSWTKLLGDIGHSAPRFRGSSPILIRSNNPGEIWFAGPRKDLTGWLWKSSDGGKSWNKAGGSHFDTNKARTLHNISAYANQIWVGSDNGLFVSTNGGDTFVQVNNHPEVGMIQRFSTGPNAGVGLITRASVNSDGGGVTRITASDFDITGTYKSDRAATQNIHFGYPTGLQIFSDGTASAWNTSADRHGYSTDGGLTFAVRGTTLNTTNVPVWTTAAIMTAKNHPDYGTDQVIQVGNDPNKWMITGGGAGMKSLDKGLSWSYFPNGSGIAAVKTYSVGVSRHNANRLYIPASDIGSAIVNDGGASGTATYSSTKTNAYLHHTFRIMEGPDLNNLVIAGVKQNDNRSLLLKSSDGGQSWTEKVPSNLPASSAGISKSVMSFDNANDFIVVLGEAANTPAKRVYRTTDGGSIFNPVSTLPDFMETGHRYDVTTTFIERDATLANVRYFVSRAQRVDGGGRSTEFYRSTDNGVSWTVRTHPFAADLRNWVHGLVADPIRSENLWAAGDDGGVKYSTDGGTTWHMTKPYFKAKYVGAYDGKIAVWGQKEFENTALLWYSSDNGVTWTAQTSPAKNFHGVQGITVDRNGKIWVSWNSITVVTPITTGNPVTDTQAPSAPTGLASGSVTSTSFTLSWTASTDNVGVSLYEVFRNGTSLGTTAGTSYNVTGLSAGTTYSMTVSARDAAGNNSAQSSALSVTTTAANNLGFENDFTSWSTYGTASINTANVRSGSKSGYFSNGGGNYVMNGLTPGATYSVKAWVKAASGTDIWVTVNTYGGAQTGQKMTSTTWTQSGDIVFTMGASNTAATLSAWTGTGSAAYFDDYTIAPYTVATTTADRTDPVGTGTVTARGENGTSEGKAKAFDNDINTKWLDFSNQSWIGFQFGNSAKYAVSRYTITSANDQEGRDPRDWKLYGSNVANPVFPNDFTQVDSRSGVNFTSRLQKLEFTISNATAYSTYRLEITANRSAGTANPANIIQLAEIELFAPSCTNCRTAGAEAEQAAGFSEGLLLYPNPVTAGSTLTLEQGAAEAGKVNVTLTDVLGKRTVTREFALEKGQNTLQLSTSGLARGIYMITVEHGSSRIVKKIYIQ